MDKAYFTTMYILHVIKFMSITETVFYCRNCLLCDNNVVKITDVAMGISLFNSDYSEVRGRSCAPIRWQPWETLLLVSLWILYSLESVKLICTKVAFVQNRQAFLLDKKVSQANISVTLICSSAELT